MGSAAGIQQDFDGGRQSLLRKGQKRNHAEHPCQEHNYQFLRIMAL